MNNHNSKYDHPFIELTIDNVVIRSKPNMNMLGLIFDSKLQWSAQAGQAVIKAKRALH